MSSVIYEISCITKKLTKEQLIETAVSFGFDEKEAKKKTTTKNDLAQYCIPRMRAFFDNEIYKKKSPLRAQTKSPSSRKAVSAKSSLNSNDLFSSIKEEDAIPLSEMEYERSIHSGDSIGDTEDFYNIQLTLSFVPTDDDGMNHISDKDLDKFMKGYVQDWVYDDSMTDNIIDDNNQKNVFIPYTSLWNNKLSAFDKNGELLPNKTIKAKLKAKEMHLYVPRYILYVKSLFFGTEFDRIRQIYYGDGGMLNIFIAKTTRKDKTKELFAFLEEQNLEDGMFEGTPGDEAVYPDPKNAEKEYGVIDYRGGRIQVKVVKDDE